MADRIKQGPIPLDEALPVAKQIAEALEAAHEAGVIHRDLKPANIKVRDDGTAKVLDFGLAKALDPNPEGDPSQSPTLTAAGTQMGVIMGTAAYMSPEQARGKTVDKRTDIWAFGCVLYEMLTGKMAFHGEDVSLTLASVMKSDLNVKALPADVAGAVRCQGFAVAHDGSLVYAWSRPTCPRLDRNVATKLLPPDLTRDETAKQRFLQEAKAASALDHPNICTIYEINETDDGQLYLVMAHYEGETLKDRIARGPLAVNDAIDIATQVGEGLAEAHGAGIVHRDIKPANLLVTKTGVVKILDFGLAKLAGAEGMTQTGTTLGTVAYMSPEQLRGEEVDQRTDIWSLGVVLYEMVAGARPFKGERLEAVSVNVLQSQPTSLGRSRTGVSADLERLVNRALVKPVAERYQSTTELLGELRTLQSSPTVVTPSQSDVPSIAVLPFANMSPDPEQEYFCEGMAEEILNALTGLEGLHVASRTSAFLAKANKFDIAEIGSRLNVKTVLEGSVRKAGNRLRVTAQLINVSDGYHLWSERYDRTMDDVFEVQDQITQSVVKKLKVNLLGTESAPVITRPTDNMEAYNLVLQGRYHSMRATGAALDKALACCTKALALEPTYAQAYAGIAMAEAIRAVISLGIPRTVMP